MGWDAYATQNGKPLEKVHAEDSGTMPADPNLQVAFCTACDEVKRRSGSGANLGTTTLGGPFQDMFERGTGCRFGGESDLLEWTSDEVQRVQQQSDWNFTVEQGDQSGELWEYWTARLFLETCATNELGILFTW